MKSILLLLLTTTIIYANELEINSFKASFIQTVTNDKGNSLKYKGRVVASKPQNMLWSYTFPAKKEIIINNYKVTVIEHDIEQVQIRNIQGDFDFFKILKNAKKIKENVYIAKFNEIQYTIKLNLHQISSISYLDALENHILIVFTEQKQNIMIDKTIFSPKIPTDFDVIRG